MREAQRAGALGGALLLCGVVAVGCDDAPTSAAFESAPARDDAGASSTPSRPPTWHRDVAPLVARHCTRCHDGGGVGPFALGTYDDARPRHLAIAAVTAAGTMPPWLPADGCRPLRAPRRLSTAEIGILRDWSRAGGPLGDPATAAPVTPPAAPKLSWVDRTLDIGADFVPRPPKGSVDVQRCFLLDPALAEDAFLVGYELVPTDRTQLFRALLLETPLAEARAKDADDPEPGWSCPGRIFDETSRVIGAWATTTDAVVYPERSGVRLRKGHGIVLQLAYHLHTSGVPDRPRLALQLARGPVDKEVELMMIAPPLVSVPPRTKGYTLATSVEIPRGGTIWGVQAHMHQLGRQVRAEARGADGAGSTCLLDIPRFDYHWEEMHWLDGRGVTVPAGGHVDVRCVWDNPTDRPFAYGGSLTDEMCELAVIVTRP